MDEAAGEAWLAGSSGECVGAADDRGDDGDAWESRSVLLGHTYRRYRDVLHVGCTLDPRGAAKETAPPELRAVSLLLRCAAAASMACVYAHRLQRFRFHAGWEEILSVARWILCRPSGPLAVLTSWPWSA
jgi:hypothetical protein